MKHVKLYEEYKYFKIDPSISNVKDPNEPFFNEPKYNYKQHKRIFGDFAKYDLIELDSDLIDELCTRGDLSRRLRIVFNKIKDYVSMYEDETQGENWMDAWYDPYLVFEEEGITDEDLRILRNLKFGINIYDDSVENSDYFGDKLKISWKWKN